MENAFGLRGQPPEVIFPSSQGFSVRFKTFRDRPGSC